MYGNDTEDYYYQKPWYNVVNYVIYSDFMKKYNPFVEPRSYDALRYIRQAPWYGETPRTTWVDGIIDYTYYKHNNKTIGHFDMHENRKNKPFKDFKGGNTAFNQHIPFKYPTLQPIYCPRGCSQEIKKYKSCVIAKKDSKKCFDEKINVMEICPKWALELYRERKRIHLRNVLIDNTTYRRAMSVSPYNQGRSLTDIKEKRDWSYGTSDNMRTDGYRLVFI